ncbi:MULTISPECIES: 50S ribosomal protein L35 [Thermotoga]|uniref:Large ribosomal subunit protein bL35 n=1 Tax=Thermotoga neapolitana (strain ATCC 49049 / DSM 4359 / NBRC 107923 / NS-E) TaxID=309803 RepID=RL35_THENN|nr:MULTISPECIES: 50S ribosomal protein L35 [Thermotoga]B9K7W1.1 RecName: Full=Large ribosomal subunit protein bL35; AltName: Full=50S ribosomal protein L35 [Thermotoga neapolitana DSM 4359]MDK2786014.1 large subunit ribosomal protein [Thermotoga sp.]HBF10471.1 50S ribosomal protein L35 [Thermotoga neapolitana]ACM23044.1 50S ribosomal protein L35 [Thermotoga neapolitana DSM 4359]AJG40960.1 50S ribosomal protein L35 [Thermotoga sp. RQ7]KFZ21857.1 50S ribosomal protein L35 [Thermotoga neapolitan
MPKMKTNRSAAKRFRVTRKGKIIRNHAYKSHKTRKKRRNVLRALRKKDVVSSADKNRVLRLLGKK